MNLPRVPENTNKNNEKTHPMRNNINVNFFAIYLDSGKENLGRKYEKTEGIPAEKATNSVP
tara:strand:+ start:90 stop:272 length:183 start_codon:yes stop_codon:yes gene_type:complete